MKMMSKNGSSRLLNLHTNTVRAVRTVKSSDLKKRIENTTISKKEHQINEIQKFISSLASKHENIIDMWIADDPENEVSKIFVLKIPESVSSEERLKIQSEIIDKCVKYCEINDFIDTFMDTAIFVRR